MVMQVESSRPLVPFSLPRSPSPKFTLSYPSYPSLSRYFFSSPPSPLLSLCHDMRMIGDLWGVWGGGGGAVGQECRRGWRGSTWCYSGNTAVVNMRPWHFMIQAAIVVQENAHYRHFLHKTGNQISDSLSSIITWPPDSSDWEYQIESGKFRL